MTNSPAPARPARNLRHRLCTWLRKRDRAAGKYDRTHRLRDVIGEFNPWWDWGHRLMALVGRDDSGSWGPPRGRDLWFRERWDAPNPATGRPNAHRWELAWSYSEMKDLDARSTSREPWRIFDWQDDGTSLVVGWYPEPGGDGRIRESGIRDRRELRLFYRWLLWDSLGKGTWFGLRRWLYYKGLHAAVERRIPFTCQLVPPPRSGGYRHWHCHVSRPVLALLAGRRQQHDGPHRFGNYTWTEGGQRVEFAGRLS